MAGDTWRLLTACLPLPSQIWDLENSVITERTISPVDFGLPLNPIQSVCGGTPLENATTLNLLLDGQLPQTDPIENFVVLNTAALLVVAGKAKDGKDGVRIARESIANGGAKRALGLFRDASQAACQGQA